jgi:hypothetical protein
VNPRALLAVVPLLLVAAPALAQMPDARAIVGRPLPVGDLPAGAVVVRVGRKIPSAGVADLEVSAIVTAPGGGESRKRTAKTGPDGRATFDGLAPGSDFKASVTLDGENLETQTFPVPAQGGIRVLLLSGLEGGPAPAEAGAEAGAGAGAAGAGQPQFRLGATTGRVEPAAGMPAGTLELTLLDEAGKPLPGLNVQLGQVATDGSLRIHQAVADGAGVARFQNLSTGDDIGYAGVIEHRGVRVGTEAFRMPADKGVRGQIRGIDRTTDKSVLRLDDRTRIILEVGEDSVQVMQELVFSNPTEKLFDPSAEPLVVPLPDGFAGAKEIEGGTSLEVRPREGIAVRTPIPPNRAAQFAVAARVGFILQANGSDRVELTQPMPFGLNGAILLVPVNARLTVESAGLKSLPDRADAQGNAVKMYEIPAIQPGGMLTVKIGGIPILNRTGRTVVAILCAGLILAAVMMGRAPRAEAAERGASAEQLSERREKLFAELVTLEQERRNKGAAREVAAAAGGGGGARAGGGKLEERRQELVGKLEGVYRELARFEHGESAPA